MHASTYTRIRPLRKAPTLSGSPVSLLDSSNCFCKPYAVYTRWHSENKSWAVKSWDRVLKQLRLGFVNVFFDDDNKQQETGRGAVCLQACSGWEVSGGYLGFFFLLIIKETSSEWDAQGNMMHFHWVKCLKIHHRYELYLKYLHVSGFSWWSLCSGSFVKFVLSVGDRSYHTCSCLALGDSWFHIQLIVCLL